jgi:hypothetical protein
MAVVEKKIIIIDTLRDPHSRTMLNMTTMASDPVLRQSVSDDENVNRTCLICGEIT